MVPPPPGHPIGVLVPRLNALARTLAAYTMHTPSDMTYQMDMSLVHNTRT
jgi:hypothetical protein